MSHEFKPGDLAVIVGTKFATETLGKTVELLEFLGSDPGIACPGGGIVQNVDKNRMWLVRLTEGAYTDNLGVTSSEGPCREQWLMPLRGDFQPEREKSREVPA